MQRDAEASCRPGPAAARLAPGYTPAASLRVLATMIVVTLTLSLATTPFGQVADPVRRAFGIDDLQFSMLIGMLFAVPSMVMSVAGGWLADRVARRRLLAVAVLTWTAGACGTALAQDYTQLAVARLLVAAAAGVKFPLAMTWLADAYPPAQRGKAVGAFFVVVGVGPAVGASISGLVLHAAQAGHFAGWPQLGGWEAWRQALFLLGLSNLLVLPAIALLRDIRPAREAAAEAAAALPGHQLPWRLVAALIAGSALFALADSANLAWLPTVLSRQHGFDAQQVGFTFGAIALVAGSVGPVLGGLLDGWALRRLGSAGRLTCCAVLALLCAPCLAAFAGHSAMLLVGALVLGGLLSMMAMPLSFLAIQAALPPQRRGLGSGIANAANNLAAASAPTLVAAVSAGLNTGPAALGQGVAAVTVGTFLVISTIYVGTARRLSYLAARAE